MSLPLYSRAHGTPPREVFLGLGPPHKVGASPAENCEDYQCAGAPLLKTERTGVVHPAEERAPGRP